MISFKLIDNIGRWCAILICIPLLLFFSYLLNKNSDNNILISKCLFIFSIIFLIYESLWLIGFFYK